MLNDILDSEDGLIIHLAHAKDFKNEEEFKQMKNKCPFYRVRGNVVTIDEKLGNISCAQSELYSYGKPV
jgi:hypothetical protein